MPMDPPQLAELEQRIEAVFERIRDERMADIPLLNPNLGVHAVGFRPWKDGAIGVLVTPWCMNLMLLPSQPEDWSLLPELSEHEQAFPSGFYRFIVGREAELGTFMSCSLFSPMFEFADDTAAVETAQAAIEGLFQSEHVNDEDAEAADIEAIWRGEKQPPPQQDAADKTDTPTDEASSPQAQEDSPPETVTISRRELLRGRLGRRAS